jgi:type IV pilus assembly protein PilN
MNILQQRTAAAQSEKQTNERRMRQPANAGVLERAHFLNALFLRKSFSWTAVLMDLETVLPAGVQVTSLEPQITAAAESNVAIRLRVSGDRDKAVMLVRNLERSKRFLVPRLISETTQAKDKTLVLANGAPPAVEFEILADYNPLPEGEPFDKKAEEKTASDARKATAKTPATKTPSTKPPAAKPNGKFPKDGVVLKPFVPKGGAR